MKSLAALFLLLMPAALFGQRADAELVTYMWQYNGHVSGTIKVPAGYRSDETKFYGHGIVTTIKYSNGSTIILQTGRSYQVPMFQEEEYVVADTEDRAGRKIRRGGLKGTDLFWREDNLQHDRPLISPDGSQINLGGYGLPNIAFDKVPGDKVELFNKSLDTFTATKTTKK